MTPAEILAEELSLLGEAFAPDELAYLAMTSKAEFAVRDRLAYRLHRRLGGEVGLVAREWRRTDLAVLRGEMPLLLLEVKAMYSFDAVGKAAGLRHFREAVRKDCQKALGHSVPETQVFSLFLVTHPQTHCGPELDHVVKYRRAIDLAAARGNGRVLEEAAAAIEKAFVGEPVSLRGTLRGGTAFGSPVCIAYWLLGPYQSAG